MKRLLVVAVLVLSLAGFGTASHAPVEESVETSGTVAADEYRYYLEQDRVAYPARYTRERVDGELVERAIYENTSVEQFAAMMGNDMAVERLGVYLEDALGVDSLEGVSTGVTADDDHHYALDVTYMVNGDAPFSYEQLQDAVPDDVTATVTFDGHTETVSFPVTTSEADIEQLSAGYETMGHDAAGAAQGGGASDGTAWSADVTRTDGTCWSGNASAGIVDVGHNTTSDRNRTIRFTGVIQAGTPCHTVSMTGVALVDGTYTVNITTERGDGICVDCVGAVTYDARFTANHDYDLVVLHNGEQVDTLHAPEFGDGQGEQQGVLERLLNWFMRLF